MIRLNLIGGDPAISLERPSRPSISPGQAAPAAAEPAVESSERPSDSRLLLILLLLLQSVICWSESVIYMRRLPRAHSAERCQGPRHVTCPLRAFRSAKRGLTARLQPSALLSRRTSPFPATARALLPAAIPGSCTAAARFARSDAALPAPRPRAVRHQSACDVPAAAAPTA